MTDADTLILDPGIALHDLLPPRDLSPSPTILVNQDYNGFNAGVIFFRICHHSITILNRVLATETELVDVEGGQAISDQQLFALVIQKYQDIQDHLYEIPRLWVNAYWGDLNWDGEELVWQVHLVNWTKRNKDWERILRVAARVYRLAEDLAIQAGHPEQNGLSLLPSAARAREDAKRWWAVAKNGIEGFKWCDC